MSTLPCKASLHNCAGPMLDKSNWKISLIRSNWKIFPQILTGIQANPHKWAHGLALQFGLENRTAQLGRNLLSSILQYCMYIQGVPIMKFMN
jgi:hypothetical protein